MTSAINAVIAHLKNALQTGIDANGALDAIGSPVYGGTDTGEAFDGMSVFVWQGGDLTDLGDSDLPAIVIIVTINPSGHEMFGDEAYSITFELIPTITSFDSVSDGTSKDDEEAINVYVDRLHDFLKLVNFPSVALLERNCKSPLKPGNKDRNNDFMYLGSATLEIHFVDSL